MHTRDDDDDTQQQHGSNDLQNNDEGAPLVQHQTSTGTTSEQLSILKLIALTCINGGLQVFFSTVMANLAPYLQALGLSKSATAAIIISIPLSGAFVGPTIGAYSDRLRTRFGRRRPIILFGALATITFLLLLAWTEEIVFSIAKGHMKSRCWIDPDGNQTCEMQRLPEAALGARTAMAVIFTILLSISVQPVQAGTRALIVDIASAEEQSRASAYVSRIQGLMAIFSFFASSLTLNELPGLGKLTQFQALSCLNLITLWSTVGITCVSVKEKDSRRLELEREQKKMGVVEFFRGLWRTVRELPEKIAQACKVQFASWMAWFPFLFYNTTYIGELVDAANMKATEGDQLAQAGSIASLCFAAVGFFFVLVLPIVLPYISRLVRKRSRQSQISDSRNEQDLIWLWLLTQPVLGLLLVLTLAVSYQWQGTIVIALAGLPWAVTQWVPWAVIGFETSKFGLADGEDNQSGAILGVHNMAISLPQVLSGAVSSVTYKIAESAGSEVPTAWVLASSGIAAFVASWLAGRML